VPLGVVGGGNGGKQDGCLGKNGGVEIVDDGGGFVGGATFKWNERMVRKFQLQRCRNTGNSNPRTKAQGDKTYQGRHPHLSTQTAPTTLLCIPALRDGVLDQWEDMWIQSSVAAFRRWQRLVTLVAGAGVGVEVVFQKWDWVSTDENKDRASD